MNNRDFEAIVEKYGEEYIYRQLAKEAIELAHAALKMVRAMREETPASDKDAKAALIEEIADMRVMLRMITDHMMTVGEFFNLGELETEKERRMIERLIGGR